MLSVSIVFLLIFSRFIDLNDATSSAETVDQAKKLGFNDEEIQVTLRLTDKMKLAKTPQEIREILVFEYIFSLNSRLN